MNVSAVSMTVSEMWPCVPIPWDLTLVPVTMVTLGTERRVACRKVGFNSLPDFHISALPDTVD